MKKTISICLILLLFTGCVQEDMDTPLPETTTTSKATTTTSLSYQNVTAPEGCESYSAQEERDNCYLTLAVNELNMTLCKKIEKLSKLKLCEMTVGGDRDGSSEVEGYVLNATTRLGVKGVKIYAINLEDAEEVAVDTTDKDGFYSMTVGSGIQYNITARIENKSYTQTQFARKNYKHELWFVIP